MPASSAPQRVTVNDIVRFVLEVFTLVTLGIWGFVVFAMPWNFVVGIGAPVFALLLWALFRSPKAVVHVGLFVKALIEIAVMGTAVFAWWDMGQTIVAIAFGIVAVVSGVINGLREIG